MTKDVPLPVVMDTIMRASLPLGDNIHTREQKAVAIAFVIHDKMSYRQAASTISSRFGTKTDKNAVNRWVSGFEARLAESVRHLKKNGVYDGDCSDSDRYRYDPRDAGVGGGEP